MLRLKKPLVILVVILPLVVIPSFAFGQKEETPHFIKIHSSYSNEPLVLDGYPNDWKDKQYTPTIFNAISSSPSLYQNNNTLSAQIFMRNNETNLALFINMHTLYPVKDQYRSVKLLFDENGDGVSLAGDNVLSIASIGTMYPTYLSDGHITKEKNIEPDPPEDLKGFQGYLRYISDSEIAAELNIPFKETNDFYDFEMLVPHDFTFMLMYTVGEPTTFAKIFSFVAGFSYGIAQNFEIAALISGIKAVSIFTFCAIISLLVVITFTRKVSSEHILVPKKLTAIILLVLFASILVVVLNPVVIEEITSRIITISDSVVKNNQNFNEVALYAIVLGVLPALFALGLFKRSEDLVSRFAIDQKILLKASIILFVIMLIPIAATPFLNIITGTAAAILKLSELEDLKSHILLFQDFMENSFNMLIVLNLSYSFSIWIPSAFLIFMLYEMRASHLKTRTKIALLSISFILFVIIAFWNVLSLFVPMQDKLIYTSLLLGPTISAILLSFMAAEGYIDTIGESLNKIKSSPRVFDKGNYKTSVNIFRRIGIKLLAILLLAITVIGLSKNLFLLTIPFVYVEFPLGYSLINEIFINTVSNYAIDDNLGQGLEAAKIVYRSVVVFFSLFWLYDIIMIFRGFGQDFLNSENLAYKTLQKHVGSITALSFLSILILFTIQESSLSFRADEINSALPGWVKQEIGIQTNEYEFLSNLFSRLGFLTGVATLLGIIYLAIRSNLFFKKWSRVIPKVGLK
jgi:hypothetical protein